MASYVSDATLNQAVDAITNQTIQVRVHSASPGNAGTSARIGSSSVDHAAAQWTAGSGGVSETTVDSAFGVLDSANSQTVTHYSLWASTTFLSWGDLASSVTVAAGESFTINSGTIEFRASRP